MENSDNELFAFLGLRSKSKYTSTAIPLRCNPVVIDDITKQKIYYPQNKVQDKEKQEDERQKYENIQSKLKHILLHTKSSTWLHFEFNCSFIDQEYFRVGNNDFEFLLNRHFPQLKGRMLTRREWSRIRSKLMKPFRFSDKFIETERIKLHNYRSDVRLIHQNRLDSVLNVANLPKKIPQSLPDGFQVSVRIDGRYLSGVIDNNSKTIGNYYCIKFNDPEMGRKLIPDYNILPMDIYSLLDSPVTITMGRADSRNIFSESSEPVNAETTSDLNYAIENFMRRMLSIITKSRKCIEQKYETVAKLKVFNDYIEDQRILDVTVDSEFIIEQFLEAYLNLENINKEMNLNFNEMSKIENILQIQLHNKIVPYTESHSVEKSKQFTDIAFQRCETVKYLNDSPKELIKNLTTLLIFMDNLNKVPICATASDTDLNTCLEAVKESLEQEYFDLFLSSVNQESYKEIELYLSSKNIRN